MIYIEKQDESSRGKSKNVSNKEKSGFFEMFFAVDSFFAGCGTAKEEESKKAKVDADTRKSPFVHKRALSQTRELYGSIVGMSFACL